MNRGSGIGHARGGESAATRPDRMGSEDRPFAEIRRNILDAARILSQHRWAFFIPCCLVSSGAFVTSLFYPRTYTATTVFERRNDPIMVDLPNSAGSASFRYFRSTMERDLTSIQNMSEVVDDLGLSRDFPRDEAGNLTPGGQQQRSALARSLGSNIGIMTTSPSEHIDIVRLTYSGPDPVQGVKLLDEVKKVYVRRTMAWIHQFLNSQREYFQQSLAEADDELKQAQREETRLRLEHPHINPQDPGALASRLDQLELEQRDLIRRKREYDAELGALRQMLATAESSWMNSAPGDSASSHLVYESPRTLQVREELRRLDEELEQLRRSRGMTDEHPEIRLRLETRQSLTARVEELRIRDRDAAPRGLGPFPEFGSMQAISAAYSWNIERARLAVQISTQENKIRDLEISLASNLSALEEHRKARVEVFSRQDEFSSAIAAVSKARHRYQEVASILTRIEPAIKAIEQDRLLQFTFGEAARGSMIPTNPKATTIVLLAVLAGLAAGVVFVVSAEILDQVYRSGSQVARSLGLPILESIDEIVTSQDRRQRLIRKTLISPVVVTVFSGLTLLSGSLAYLSIQRPWTMDRLRKRPAAAHATVAEQTHPVGRSTQTRPLS